MSHQRSWSWSLTALFLLIACVGCESTTVSTVWKTPDPLPPPFAKIVPLVVNATPAERRAAEDEIVRMLRPGQGVAGYTLISDDALKDREQVRKIIDSQGIDGLIVLRLISADTRTTYVPPTYEPSFTYDTYYGAFANPSIGYGGGYDRGFNSPGYTVTDTIFHAEISIYALRDQRLLWAGASSTTNPANVKDMVEQVVKACRAELKKQGMLR